MTPIAEATGIHRDLSESRLPALGAHPLAFEFFVAKGSHASSL